jgi:ribosomal protein S19
MKKGQKKQKTLRSRASTILPNDWHTISVYNGQKHVPVFITDPQVGQS